MQSQPPERTAIVKRVKRLYVIHINGFSATTIRSSLTFRDGRKTVVYFVIYECITLNNWSN